MVEVEYAPSFIRQLYKLEVGLQVEAKGKIELFKDPKNHQALKVHKLRGALKGKWSFSVNYKYRILFQWNSKNEAGLLAIDDHDVYK